MTAFPSIANLYHIVNAVHRLHPYYTLEKKKISLSHQVPIETLYKHYSRYTCYDISSDAMKRGSLME